MGFFLLASAIGYNGNMSNQPENDTSEKETKADKPKRRWYQYSLRSLMIVMTVLCVWLGYISNEAMNQKAAVWVEEVGGRGGKVLL